jgi:hypothetical protein
LEEVTNYASILKKYREDVNSVLGEMSGAPEYSSLLTVHLLLTP